MNQKTIWVVDDEPAIIATLETILKTEGYVAKGFLSRENPLSEAKTSVPDVLVADVSLPDLTGIELANRVKALNPNCKVILLSTQANISETIWRYVTNEGRAFELLSKPVHPKVLLAVIEPKSDGRPGTDLKV